MKKWLSFGLHLLVKPVEFLVLSIGSVFVLRLDVEFLITLRILENEKSAEKISYQSLLLKNVSG
jgi:hypothetical protein